MAGVENPKLSVENPKLSAESSRLEAMEKLLHSQQRWSKRTTIFLAFVTSLLLLLLAVNASLLLLLLRNFGNEWAAVDAKLRAGASEQEEYQEAATRFRRDAGEPVVGEGGENRFRRSVGGSGGGKDLIQGAGD